MMTRLIKVSIFSFAFVAILFSCNSVKNGNHGTANVSDGDNTSHEELTVADNSEVNSVTSNKVWYNWEEGYAYAKKNNKIILVDAYTDWCGWCKVMDKKTYANASIKTALKKDFVSIKINPERPKSFKIGSKSYSGAQLLKFLSGGSVINSYPTTLFWLDPSKSNEGKKKYVQIGYLNPSQMKDVLKKMVSIKKK